MIKIRIFPDYNYKAFHLNGKTIRIALDPNKPIGELNYPEFYDVKVTNHCLGNCSHCYQNSISTKHPDNIVEKFLSFFSKFDKNQKPFQIAFGGGEPTSHPNFIELLKECHKLDIIPNYTTNGMWVDKNPEEIILITKEYCGGVAVSTHSHLEKYWRKAIEYYLNNNIFTNLHIIIGNRQSIDTFISIYKEYKDKIKYFVLLPLTAQGRAKKQFNDWEYLSKSIEGSPADIAFGANFYPYLLKDKNRFNVSLYEPEIMSAYLDLETMKVFKSSFSTEERVIG
jgi:sulfatase maturation enzyme AslB (radical SAM superfamily)